MTFIIRKKFFKEMYVLSQDFEVSGGGRAKPYLFQTKRWECTILAKPDSWCALLLESWATSELLNFSDGNSSVKKTRRKEGRKEGR